jgi:hypothetical protein
MALAICGQQNRAAMRRRVARTPGWCIECSDWKTASLCWIGTSGRNTPVETSPSSVVTPPAWVVICSVEEFIISATSGQARCVAAIAEKSTGWGEAERHEEVLEQTERHDDHRCGDVLGRHRYLMVTLHQVYAGEELAAVQIVGEVEDAGEGVAVVCRCQVVPAVVAAGPP